MSSKRQIGRVSLLVSATIPCYPLYIKCIVIIFIIIYYHYHYHHHHHHYYYHYYFLFIAIVNLQENKRHFSFN